MAESEKYRLVTRSDFDGMVSGVLLKHLDMIAEVIFVHPKDMQDGKVEITLGDITTNLPYVEGAHLVIGAPKRRQVVVCEGARGDNEFSGCITKVHIERLS